MKNFSFKKTAAVALLGFLMMLTGVGLREAVRTLPQSPAQAPSQLAGGWTLKEPEATEYIDGPVAASGGDLCVFRLSDGKARADWIIVPEATCYIDSSGSSLAFASNRPATYTVIAAVVEDGLPKILQHVCDYGASPEPTPSPSPTPKPDPAPQSLGEWVRRNIPDAGRSQCAALASCYESTAEAIDKGSIQSQTAAYSALRTATQTKIKIEHWSEFLDGLSVKIADSLRGNTEVKRLGTLLREIAEALKTVSDTEPQVEREVSAPDILPYLFSVTHGNERRAA